MKKIGWALILVLCGGLSLMAAEGTLDLRVFDDRASTFLARMAEVGMPVYRLVDVADIHVPKLKRGTAPRQALEQVAKHSGLELRWVQGKPLLCKFSAEKTPELKSLDAVRREGWLADHATLQALLAAGAATKGEMRRAYAEAVLRFGRAGLGAALIDRKPTEALVRTALGDNDWLLRRQAVLAAVDLGFPDAEDIVEQAARGPHSELIRGAALAAGRLGNKKGGEILERLINPDFVDKRFRKDVQYAATYGCVELGGDRAVAILEKMVFGKNVYLGAWALRAAGQVGNEKALALLKRAADHKDPRIKRGAAIGLGFCRAEGTMAALEPLLMWTTDSKGVWIQPPGPAAIALGRQGGDKAVELLVKAWDKPKHAPRPEILYALCQIGTRRAMDFIKGHLKDKDERIRNAAAWALDRDHRLDASPLRVDDLDVQVVNERPRVFLRAHTASTGHGPTLDELRRNFYRPDYQRAARRDKLPRSQLGQVLLWLLTGDEFAGLDAATWACEMQYAGFGRARGKTPSYAGISVQRAAATYDWLHEHGDFDPINRRMAMHHLEDWARDLGRWIRDKNSTVFYSRRWGALAGSGIAALAIFGESPAGPEYLRQTMGHLYSKDGLGTIRQAQDGVTAGSCYGLHHMFTDNANLLAAITYGTDWDAATFTQEHRGDWLQKQLYFQMHCTYPDGSFFKDGDLWSAAAGHSQYRMQVDVITRLYQNGIGRLYADWMGAKWPEYYPSDYHTDFVWQFYVFNDPDVVPRPLSELTRCMLFSPEIDGYALWRSSWKPDATIVHFHCGDTLDMHGGSDQGKFVIYKRAPLANKNGGYHGYGSPVHNYYRHAISGNTVLFERAGRRGKGTTTSQISYINKAGGVNSFEEFKNVRATLGPPVGRIVTHEVTPGYARAVGVLDGSTPDRGRKHKWTRELVFLNYETVLVLDRVRTGPGTKVKWILNFAGEPQVDGEKIRFDNGQGRLFCQTLLPERPSFTRVGGKGAPKVMGKQWRVEVTAPDPAAAEQTFLHVLYPTDTGTSRMPSCAMTRKGDTIAVRVGEHTYAFKTSAAPGS